MSTKSFIKNPYWLGFSIVVLCYLIVYGWLLWFSDCLPYVMDNNESFSAFTHAYNLYHGDLSKSFGLTDEVVSPFSDAHPMIHTHQGNWPRIFIFLLYSLGTKTIESQIVITTFTIGLLAILMMYHYFTRISTCLFSTLVCSIIMSDYILFSQWQVNTYQVWHSFFVFSSLLCVHGLTAGVRKKTWIVLTILNYACLFYGELIFAIFLSLWIGLYGLFLYFRQIKKVVLPLACQAIGVVIGCGTLIAQLVFFMGWRDVIQDIKFTFLARNFASKLEGLHSLSDFYDKHNIIFIHNIQDGSSYRAVSNFIKSFFQYGFQAHSALFNIIVFVLCLFWWITSTSSLSKNTHYKMIGLGGVIFSLVVSAGSFYCNQASFMINFLSFSLFATSMALCVQKNVLLKQTAVVGILTGSFAVFLLAFLSHYNPMPRVPHLVSSFILLAFSYLLARLVMVLNNPLGAMKLSNEMFSHKPVFLGVLFILSISFFVNYQNAGYDTSLKELWLDMLSAPYSSFVWGLGVSALVSSLLVIILREGEAFIFVNPKEKGWLDLRKYLLSGLGAYLIIYNLSPGYLHSGYLVRYVPFYHVFFMSVLTAIAIYTLIMAIKYLSRVAYIYWPTRMDPSYRSRPS